LSVCPTCGWWVAEAITEHDPIHPGGKAFTIAGATAILKEFDVTNADAPVEEVRNYLAARFQDRFRVDPDLFEEVVASVFRSNGYHAVTTGCTGDGGIDIILQKGDEHVGG